MRAARSCHLACWRSSYWPRELLNALGEICNLGLELGDALLYALNESVWTGELLAAELQIDRCESAQAANCLGISGGSEGDRPAVPS